MNSTFAELVASVPADEGKRLLSAHLGIAADGDELRNEIFVECMYDVFAFCMSRGFSWRAVGEVLDAVRQLIEFAAGHSIDETAVAFNDAALQLRTVATERQLTMLTDYVFSTVMQHFRLYQYVFSRQRATLTFDSRVLVEAPASPEPLRKAKLPAVDAYERTMTELEAGERELAAKLDAHQRQRDVNAARIELASTVFDLASASLLPQNEAVQRIVQEVMQNISGTLTKSLADEITDYSQDIALKLAKASLSRPKELGPLPKFPLKPAINGPKTQEKRSHSPAAKSKTK